MCENAVEAPAGYMAPASASPRPLQRIPHSRFARSRRRMPDKCFSVARIRDRNRRPDAIDPPPSKMTAEPLIELEVREMRCIPGRKCDLAEFYSRLSIGIEIDAGELHIAGDGFCDADHVLEIARPCAQDWRVPVSGRNVLPIWRIERYSRPRKAINVDLDKTSLAVKTEELVVIRRTSTVEIDELLQKQLRLEGAILPLAPIVAEPGGEPTFSPAARSRRAWQRDRPAGSGTGSSSNHGLT